MSDSNGATATADKPARKQTPRKQTQKPTLAQRATETVASKRKPVFHDVAGIPRVALADGRVGCVQAEMILQPDGSIAEGPQMLTIPRRNADGTEAGQRFPLADIQLLADGFRAGGIQLV